MKPGRRSWAPWLAALLLVAAVLVPALALARPGGGSSYSGSSRSSGGGGGGSGGGSGGGELLFDLIFFLLRLCIEVPAVGIPLTVVIIVVVIAVLVSSSRSKAGADWSVGAPGRGAGSTPASVPHVARGPGPRAQLELLRGQDPDFSLVLFEDFLYALYAEVHAARGAQKLESLSAYVAPQARAALASPGLAAVRDVVVGAMRFVQVSGASGAAQAVSVVAEFEANYTEVAQGGREQGYYVSERWTLSRRPGARSRPPERVKVFTCPNCGAPLENVRGGQCAYCRQQVDTGAFDWVVAAVQPTAREARAPLLTADVQEQGTNLPTVVDPAAAARMRELSGRDPTVTWESLQQRARLIHREINAAWSSQDWSRARAFLSDSLFQMQMYWMEAYRKAGLRNATDNARVLDVQLARVSGDKYFDAVTVRVFATGLDYTVDQGGRLVSGSKSRERAYTEYWTLIRGSARRGATRTDARCPNCGAPLKISMAGHCEYCRAKVSSGEFDWVLSRIEQDESYAG